MTTLVAVVLIAQPVHVVHGACALQLPLVQPDHVAGGQCGPAAPAPPTPAEFHHDVHGPVVQEPAAHCPDPVPVHALLPGYGPNGKGNGAVPVRGMGCGKDVIVGVKLLYETGLGVISEGSVFVADDSGAVIGPFGVLEVANVVLMPRSEYKLVGTGSCGGHAPQKWPVVVGQPAKGSREVAAARSVVGNALGVVKALRPLRGTSVIGGTG